MSTIDQEITKRYESEPLFRSAHDALVFAFNFSMDLYDRPLMNKMADEARPPGKGLSGLDGAAQAGFVRAELHSLGVIPEALLIARIAPRSQPCDCRRACCSGQSLNPEWIGAVEVIVQHTMAALSGCGIVHYRVRRASVLRYFGERVSLTEAAEICGISKNTVTDHNQKILKVLKTDEAAAWGRFETRLIASGMVEQTKNG